MNYTIHKYPFTYIVIEDWSPDLNSYISEIDPLIPLMNPSIVYGNNTQVTDARYKSSYNMWLYNNLNGTSLARKFEKDLWTDKFKAILTETEDSLFRSLCYTDSSQILLSRYEQGDHYAWHRDYNETVTINYMIARDPLRFTGGDFIFGGWDEEEPLVTIPFKPNTLIVFPSRVKHMVTPVKDFNSGASFARFTLQYWSKLRYIVEQ